ncbi:MAG TPA: substrate-binding domain-containing protein [Spirochaetia bacterium]|nr:substrate-binding domain-containing protein [Spirochaetia bacterium]
MTRERRLVVILAGASVLLAIGLTVAFRANTVSVDGSRPKPRIAVIFKTVDYTLSFWQTVKDGVESASKDFGVNSEIIGPRSETEVDEQIRMLNHVIRTKPDAIVLAATDYDRLVPVAQRIRQLHIPLVTIDSFIAGDSADTKIGTDNYDAGRKAGVALLNYVGNGGRVVIMSYVRGSSTAIDRESGVRDALKGKVDIERTIFSEGEIETAYSQAMQLLKSDPTLKGMVALNDPTTIGVARALSDSGRQKEVALIGFDNSLPVLSFVEAGIVRDTVVQRPFNMGYLGIKTALELIRGRKVQSFIDTGSQLINLSNMLTPENQKLLFPVAQ